MTMRFCCLSFSSSFCLIGWLFFVLCFLLFKNFLFCLSPLLKLNLEEQDPNGFWKLPTPPAPTINREPFLKGHWRSVWVTQEKELESHSREGVRKLERSGIGVAYFFIVYYWVWWNQFAGMSFSNFVTIFMTEDHVVSTIWILNWKRGCRYSCLWEMMES